MEVPILEEQPTVTTTVSTDYQVILLSYKTNVEEPQKNIVNEVEQDGNVDTWLDKDFSLEMDEVLASCVIDVDGKLSGAFVKQLEGLIELLFSVINRPNHSVDRQTRAVGCECLRKLERACPCLLSQVAGNLWSLCQSERTHAAQSYVLLLAQKLVEGYLLRAAHRSDISAHILIWHLQGESCEPETGKESKEKDTSVALKSQAMAEQMEELRSKVGPCTWRNIKNWSACI
ncbi:uncharacterized protein LOC141680551 [Apium graveolens]|uniref:uncharacterized protein LOC141680551 n=1 Tax=Apium graveolens TaxID=4045 RepID=UPI003D7B62C8